MPQKGSIWVPPDLPLGGPKKNPTWNTRKKGHGGPPAEWPPPQVSENLKCYEAVERGAVTDSRKNLIGKGCGLLSDRTGELLTQTLPSEPLNCHCMAAK